ncbi:pyridoxal-phosphate dependent enzyme [Allorhizocola rhizosphaerae]|uniref:pyridoxal-phosphate dependent enzyme n=1 Tax=Allorhizocola rhizosphaerae TaxID=1872709 RepID=UPI000E3DABB8|nr:pyridoxal-phosphate dependent enzyme [Allorhizocola rhizosphaerae]
MRIHESVVDLIGDTPLVRLARLGAGCAPTVVAKLESLNPGGSAKDRIALRMIETAEASGHLRPGGTVVEPTSGNTGVGLALVAQRKGYRCVFTCPDKVSPDKIAVLRAYGAEVVICPAAVPPEHPDSYRSTAQRLAQTITGAFLPDQYSNPDNPASHYHVTGPEIWAQTGGRITHLVAGIGTGGTISGAGRYLKEVSQGAVRIVGADPDGSVYTGGGGRPYLVEGVGQPNFPESFDQRVPDEIIPITDADSINVTRRLAREEGILTGGSGGMAVAAALHVAATGSERDLIVVIIPDSGRGYLSKIFNDEWLFQFGFEQPDGDGLRAGHAISPLIVVDPAESVAVARKLMRANGLSCLPVSPAPPPVRFAEIIGSFRGDAAPPDDAVGRHLDPPLPAAGYGQFLDGVPATAVVLKEGIPIGLVERRHT